MLRRHGHVYSSVAVLSDAVTISAAWMAAYYFRFRIGLFPFVESRPPGPEPFVKLLPIVVFCDLVALFAMGLYRPAGTHSIFKEWLRVIRGAVIGWLAMLAFLYYYSSTPYSRVLLGIFFIVNPFALVVSRTLVRLALGVIQKGGWGVKKAAIIGTGRLAQETFFKVDANPLISIRVAYFISDEKGNGRSDVRGVPVIGTIAELGRIIGENPVDMVFIAVPARNADAVDEVLNALARLPVRVAIIPDFKGVITLSSSVAELDGLPVIQLRDTPIQGWHAVAKRAFDIVVSFVILVGLSPLMLFLAAVVKLTSKGPVLFKQERMGLGGKPFIMLKFRSMRLDAEQETGPVWAGEDDPRRTWIGALMRRTSLDELPQLINVLKGDMSLVGPRPERPHFVREFTDNLPAYMLRHNVKAGLTGWAQVKGLRGNTSLKKRLQYDLYYINNWSLGFDLLIVLLTPFSGLINRHAY